MANLKRLWDTENKKIVWAIPTSEPYKKLQVWTNDDGSKLYVYRNSQYLELDTSNATVAEYGHYWKEINDEMVGYYLTSEPTDLYNWDSGDEAAYRFLNGTTVLQSGKVDEGETPEYTGDTPTKAATAQYTYTFSGWNPTVGPIYKKTDFEAQFTSTVNEYTVSIASEDTNKGTVDKSSVADIPYGTKLSIEDNVLTIGEGTSATEVTATAETGYVFSSWGEVPATVTGNTSITATFVEDPNFAIIRSDLGSLNPATLGATIASGESFTETINGRTYEFEPTSENSADVIVVIDGVTYGTSVTVETDAIVVGEITVAPEEDPEL